LKEPLHCSRLLILRIVGENVQVTLLSILRRDDVGVIRLAG
jgi:hypothetical protein